jgi:hypothetical protein
MLDNFYSIAHNFKSVAEDALLQFQETMATDQNILIILLVLPFAVTLVFSISQFYPVRPNKNAN